MKDIINPNIVLYVLLSNLALKQLGSVLLDAVKGKQRGEAIPAGKIVPSLGNARQGIGYGWYEYAGPKPPKGNQHLYRFTIYALDSEIELSLLPTKSSFMKKAKGHVIQWGSIVGEFE